MFAVRVLWLVDKLPIMTISRLVVLVGDLILKRSAFAAWTSSFSAKRSCVSSKTVGSKTLVVLAEHADEKRGGTRLTRACNTYLGSRLRDYPHPGITLQWIVAKR